MQHAYRHSAHSRTKWSKCMQWHTDGHEIKFNCCIYSLMWILNCSNYDYNFMRYATSVCLLLYDYNKAEIWSQKHNHQFHIISTPHLHTSQCWSFGRLRSCALDAESSNDIQSFIAIASVIMTLMFTYTANNQTNAISRSYLLWLLKCSVRRSVE